MAVPVTPLRQLGLGSFRWPQYSGYIYLDEEDDVRAIFPGLLGLVELTQHCAVDGEVVS